MIIASNANIHTDKISVMNCNHTVVSHLPITSACGCAGASEKCGQGSLLILQQRLVAQIPDIDYSCYDIFGYPVNPDASLVEVTDCAANIITSIQEGIIIMIVEYL